MDSRGVLIFDEGEERAYTRLVRNMGVYNPIAIGTVASGQTGRGSEIFRLSIRRPAFQAVKAVVLYPTGGFLRVRTSSEGTPADIGQAAGARDS